jgi:hypothetical protein
VSGHGLGHASRAAQVIRRIPRRVPVTVKSAAPEWFFRLECGRPFDFVAERFDAGAAQASNFAIDWRRTLSDAAAVQKDGEGRLAAEAEFLRRTGAGCVVCDVPPLPLRAAQMAGIPGVAVANFTWVEILRPLAHADARAAALVDAYRGDYGRATLALRTPLAFEMPYFPRVRDIPLIARRGRPCRARLARALGMRRGDRAVLLYLGVWGGDGVRFDRLAQMRGVRFVSFWDAPPPVVKLDTAEWGFPEVLASVDAVVAKPGYGTVGECMANGTPVVYYPRPEFAEYRVLRDGLESWSGAVRITRDALMACRWQPALERAFALQPRAVDCSGARKAGDAILAMASR